MQRIIFIGKIGSDAGGWYIGADGKVHRVPGWNPEQMVEVTHAINALREISQLKTAGLAERLTATLHEVIHKELGAHTKAGDVIVLG
jgi:hypothetical protein